MLPSSPNSPKTNQLLISSFKSFKAISKAVSIMIDKGKIYQPGGRLDAKVLVTDNKRVIPLKISGTTSNPKIKLDSSFVKDELKKKAKKIAEEICKKLLTNVVIEDYTINLK